MGTIMIPTDHTKRSMLEYGALEFPFVCYLDKISGYRNRHIEWHWHREFELSFVIEGVVHCFVDDECITLYPGEALFINSEMIHHFESDDGIMYNIVFAPEFIANISSTVFQKNVAPYLTSNCKYFYFSKSASEDTLLLEIIKSIGVLSRTATCNQEIKLYSRVLDFWVHFVDTSKGTLTQKNNADRLRQERLRKMMEYIQSHYAAPISLRHIAESANISTSEALRCFRSGLKTTPINYLNDYRMSVAFSQLMSSRSPVYQIASSVGFENASYFCRKFKKRYGVSPKCIQKNCTDPS